jgi:hypothetical protein
VDITVDTILEIVWKRIGSHAKALFMLECKLEKLKMGEDCFAERLAKPKYMGT